MEIKRPRVSANFPRKKPFLLLGYLLPLLLVQASYADFINGGFEDTYTPTPAPTNPYNTITGWTLTGYTFVGTTVVPPTSIEQLGLNTQSTYGGTGISDIVRSLTPQSSPDYFLEGATLGTGAAAFPLFPIAGNQTALINLRSIDAPLYNVGTNNPIPLTGSPVFTTVAKQATSISQTMTVEASDFDPTDGKVHVRFIAVAVLENPSHLANQQPFVAIQLNNITTGRTGSNPLFFEWNYGGQAGVGWNNVGAAGTNPGTPGDQESGTGTGPTNPPVYSWSTYQYLIFQAFDIAPGNAFIGLGDSIELVAIASGCSLGGHDGHLYLDEVGTGIPQGLLWVSASGPASAAPGSNITYTYTYVNTESTAVNDVQIVANLPLPTTSTNPASTSYVSVTTPTAGTSPSCSGAGPVTCDIGTLQPGETGTFQLTVSIPNWSTTVGPLNNGNYPISGQGVSTLLGPLVQTALVAPANLSNLVANTSGLPTTASIGTPYSGTFSCSNIPTPTASDAAPAASCGIANLPAGLSVAGCTISPSSTAWAQPETIPADATVTCAVTGTPTTSGTFTATVTADASNNSNSTTNHANAIITVNPLISATLNGSPILSPAIVCCGRPVILGPLPGPGPTDYFVAGSTGNAICVIGQSGTQTYLKMNGAGSCTIIGTKDGVLSAPFTVVAP